MLVWSGHCPEIHPPLRDHREWYRRREDAPVADDLSHRTQKHASHVQDHDRGSEAPIRRAFPTRYDRWRRASGHKCDTNEVTHQAKTGGAYSHAAETRVPCPYKCEWHLQLEH
jgi:hypothetical protein